MASASVVPRNKFFGLTHDDIHTRAVRSPDRHATSNRHDEPSCALNERILYRPRLMRLCRTPRWAPRDDPVMTMTTGSNPHRWLLALSPLKARREAGGQAGRDGDDDHPITCLLTSGPSTLLGMFRELLERVGVDLCQAWEVNVFSGLMFATVRPTRIGRLRSAEQRKRFSCAAPFTS